MSLFCSPVLPGDTKGHCHFGETLAVLAIYCAPFLSCLVMLFWHVGHPSSRSIRMNYFLSKLHSLCTFGYNNLTVLQHRLVRFQILWSLPLHINESWMIHIIHSIHIISTSYLTVQEKLWKTSESRVLWNTVLGPFPLELSAAVISMWDMQ